MARIFEQEGEKRIAGREEAVRKDGPAITVQTKAGNATGDLLFVATGRAPLVHNIGLEAAKVRYSERGIQGNGHLQTTASHIYAAGDVTGGPQYSHRAGWQGFQAVRNARPHGKHPRRAESM